MTVVRESEEPGEKDLPYSGKQHVAQTWGLFVIEAGPSPCVYTGHSVHTHT